MLPKGRKGTNSGGVIAVLQEVAEAFSFRPSVRGILGVIDVDLEL